MSTVAYLRVSTGSQDLDTQRLAILEYAHQKGLTVDAFIETQMSSRREEHKRHLNDVLGQLQAGDTILVSELSRLGRSVGILSKWSIGLLKHSSGLWLSKKILSSTEPKIFRRRL